MSILVVAICDANTLIPARVNDFLMTAAEHGLFELVLSEPILAEVERNLILIHHDIDPAKLTARVEMMRRFFKDQIVTGFEDDIDRQPVNEHDRHVTAAAFAAGADILVTNDGALLEEIRRYPRSRR